MEYSEFRDGDRPCTACAKGTFGEYGIETLLLEDNFLFLEKPDPVVDALFSSSELSMGIDRMLGCLKCGDIGGCNEVEDAFDDFDSIDMPRCGSLEPNG